MVIECQKAIYNIILAFSNKIKDKQDEWLEIYKSLETQLDCIVSIIDERIFFFKLIAFYINNYRMIKIFVSLLLKVLLSF